MLQTARSIWVCHRTLWPSDGDDGTGLQRVAEMLPQGEEPPRVSNEESKALCAGPHAGA